MQKYLADFARTTPDKPAMIFTGSGAVVTYRELDAASNRLANLLMGLGLKRGDCIALFMENTPRFVEVCWAAIRSGLYVCPVNRYLKAPDVAYIVGDCRAKCIITSIERADVAALLPPLIPDCPHHLMAGGVIPGWASYEESVASQSTLPVPVEWMGDTMMYSSGTTGRPKGILRPLSDKPISESVFRRLPMLVSYGLDQNSIYLSPAPLYHSAPVNFVLGVQFLGGTAIVMEKFDAVQALQAIERYGVTCSQWVPTMFVRMLKLEPQARTGFDLSSHRLAIHAAAPCPVETKRQMIEWWGPIVAEYYAASEGNGMTKITSEDWLAHPGSVGRATQGILHICDDEGNELPAGEIGLIYFEHDRIMFEYHNDAAKTRASQHPHHPTWSAVGDIGYVDSGGYLFLTDRKSFMIISGGVNIYPRQIEDIVILHPSVADVAVLGVPDEEMGEQVKAVVELIEDADPSDALAEELRRFAVDRMAGYMVPKSFDFVDALPRLPTGKLYKQELRARYWPAPTMAKS